MHKVYLNGNKLKKCRKMWNTIDKLFKLQCQLPDILEALNNYNLCFSVYIGKGVDNS